MMAFSCSHLGPKKKKKINKRANPAEYSSNNNVKFDYEVDRMEQTKMESDEISSNIYVDLILFHIQTRYL
jgi:hypothetical protein